MGNKVLWKEKSVGSIGNFFSGAVNKQNNLTPVIILIIILVLGGIAVLVWAIKTGKIKLPFLKKKKDNNNYNNNNNNNNNN